MKFLISGLRLLGLVLAALVLASVIALGQGWHTPLVNYFVAPYKIHLSHTELNWFPLSLEIEGLQAGEGDSALSLESIFIRSGWGFITGDAVDLYVQLGQGALGYHVPDTTQQGKERSDDLQLAGLTVSQWRELFADKGGSKANSVSGEEHGKSPLAIHLQSLQVSNFRIESHQEGMPDLMLNRLLFGPFYSDQPEKPSSLQIDFVTANGAFNLKGAVSPLSAAPQLNLDISIEDFAPSHQWLAQVPKELSATLNSSLSLQANLMGRGDDTANEEHKFTLSLSGEIMVDQARWRSLQQTMPSGEEPDNKFQLQTLNLSGFVLDLRLKDLSNPLPILTIKADQIKVSDPDIRGPELSAGLSHLQIDQLRLASDLSAEIPRMTLNLAQLELADADVAAGAQQNAQRYQSESIMIRELQASTLLQHADETVQLFLEELRLNQLSMNQSDLSYQLKTLLVRKLDLILGLSSATIQSQDVELAEGRLDYQLPVTPDKAVTQPAESSQLSPPYQVSYSGELIRLLKQEISYRDFNLKDAPLTQIELTDIQLREPQYPARKPFPWTADLLLNGESRWRMQGALQTEPLRLQANIDQSGLNLPDISPYSEHYAEVVFTEGSMNNSIELELTANSLQGRLDFDFSHLDMTLKGSQSSLNLPLKTAFSLLEDSDNRIELSIELDKKGEDLNVDTSAIVKELVLTASQKGAVAYLKYALQPYGALLTLKDIGSGMLKSGSIPLESVVLELQQESFTAEQVGYAQKVGGILKEKEAFKLHYCYLPSEIERQQLLVGLADSDKADTAFRTLNQTRTTQWRKLFAEQGLAARLKQCTQQELNNQKDQLASDDTLQSRFTLVLKP